MRVRVRGSVRGREGERERGREGERECACVRMYVRACFTQVLQMKDYGVFCQ